MPASSHARHRFYLLAAALLFSTGGAAIKAASLNSWQVAGSRSLVAAAALLLLFPAARRGWNWRVVPAGTAYASTMVLFVLANKLTTSANAIFLQSTAPLYLLLLGPWLLKERIRRSDFVFLLAVSLGMAMFFAGTEGALPTAPDPRMGNLVAAASGVAWALTIAGLRWVSRGQSGESSMPTVVAGNLIAFLICLPFGLPVMNAGWNDLLVALYLGLFQIGLAYICLTRGLRHVPAFEASALLLVEPGLNPIWAWLVHAERPGAWALTGGSVIILSNVVNSWWQSRTPRHV